MKPVINKRKCPAQGNICKIIPICPNHAISYVKDEKEKMGGRIEIDETLCIECGLCAEECCGHAIDLTD